MKFFGCFVESWFQVLRIYMYLCLCLLEHNTVLFQCKQQSTRIISKFVLCKDVSVYSMATWHALNYKMLYLEWNTTFASSARNRAICTVNFFERNEWMPTVSKNFLWNHTTAKYLQQYTGAKFYWLNYRSRIQQNRLILFLE